MWKIFHKNEWHRIKHECRSFPPRHFPVHHLHFRIFLWNFRLILLFKRPLSANLLPRLSGTDGLYDFSYLHVFPELISFCNTHIGTSSPRGTSSARYIPEGTVLPPRKGQCRTSGIYACTNAPFHGPKSFGTVRDSSSWQLPSPSVDARNWNR